MILCFIALYISAMAIYPCRAQIRAEYTDDFAGHQPGFANVMHYGAQESMIAHADTNKITMVKFLDPLDAFGLAVIPGVVLRGAGHWYANRYLMSAGLFIASVIGLKLYFDAGEPSGRTTDKYGHSYWYENKYHDLKIYSGLILWFGTWAYDLIGAPVICIRHNRQIKASLSMQPCLLPSQDSTVPGIRLCWSF